MILLLVSSVFSRIFWYSRVAFFVFALILIHHGKVVQGERVVRVFSKRQFVLVDGQRVFALVVEFDSPVKMTLGGSGIVGATRPHNARQ